jgi:4'-phosphopantetheinyl transferase
MTTNLSTSMNPDQGEVHIWSANINENYNELLRHSYLSEEEKRQAVSFHQDIDGYLFSVRHNLLRIILARYLDCQPEEIKFKRNAFQKPAIDYPISPIQFNLSVSSNRFVAAFCQNHSVGVDIELIRQLGNIDRLIFDYFTQDESAWILSRPNHEKTSAFFDLWTKKEALIKAVGQGLSIPLNQLNVLSPHPVFWNSEDWHIIPLSVFEDCRSALAINSPLTISLFSFVI